MKSLPSLFLVATLPWTLHASPIAMEVISPLDNEQKVGFTWVGGIAVDHPAVGRIFITPTFLNGAEGEGRGSWMGRNTTGLKLASGGDTALTAETTIEWPDAGPVNFTIEAAADGNKLNTKSAWTGGERAAGNVVMMIRVPHDPGFSWRVEAGGKVLFEADGARMNSAEGVEEITVTEATTNTPVFRITFDPAKASTYVFTENPESGLLIQMNPFRQLSTTLSEVEGFGMSIEFLKK